MTKLIALFCALELVFVSRLAAQEPAPPKPALVVLIAIDQYRADYFDRFSSQLTGGLRRIRDESILFVNGHQEHAATETAPGHSTMMSGREPYRTHIVSNDRGVPDAAAPLIGSSRMGASPRRFEGTTLVDWMIAKDSATRVLSVSRKDRGAILPIGRSIQPVFWYADAQFTTSSYYADTLPTWVRAFNATHTGASLPATWTQLLPDSAYKERDDYSFEHGGRDFVFPHAFAALPADRAKKAEESPWMDSLTLAFALRGVGAIHLGQRPNGTDVLTISLSTTDKIGHTYGPDSREIHDHVLRLDRWLGVFLDSLATFVPRNRMLLALTADHGVSSMPEYVTSVLKRPGGRVDGSRIASQAEHILSARYRTPFGLEFDNGLLTGDIDALHARGVNTDSLAASLAAAFTQITGVKQAYTHKSLAAASAKDGDATRWKRNLPPAFGWLVAAVAKPGYAFTTGVDAQHGTMQPETVQVPIAFLVPGQTARRVERVVNTVDIAPTFAALLGVKPLEALDGVALREVTRKP